AGALLAALGMWKFQRETPAAPVIFELRAPRGVTPQTAGGSPDGRAIAFVGLRATAGAGGFFPAEGQPQGRGTPGSQRGGSHGLSGLRTAGGSGSIRPAN